MPALPGSLHYIWRCRKKDKNYAWRLVAEPALRRPDVVEEPRLHRDSRVDAQPGHRRDHGHLQCGLRHVVRANALSEARPTDDGVDKIRRWTQLNFGGRLP